MCERERGEGPCDGPLKPLSDSTGHGLGKDKHARDRATRWTAPWGDGRRRLRTEQQEEEEDRAAGGGKQIRGQEAAVQS